MYSISIIYPTTGRKLQSTLTRMQYISALTGVTYNFTIEEVTNYLFYIDIQMSITLTGPIDDIESFRTLLHHLKNN